MPKLAFESKRFNATWQGKRTTVRVPSFLCRLHALCIGFDTDEQVFDDLRAHLRICDERGEDRDLTASQSCIDYMQWNIEDSFFYVGFNPDNSRAPVPGQTPALSAAEARRTTDKEPSPRG